MAGPRPAARLGWLAGAVAWSFIGTGAFAAESAPVVSARTTATLVTETDSVRPGEAFWAGLRLQLAPGWHTYWRNPGDAGIPPSLDVVGPDGTKAGALQWPVPTRVAEGTLTAYAYTGDVLLPFLVTPGASPLSLRAHAQWLACRDICVPEEAELDVQLATGSASQSPQAGLIAAARAKVPGPAEFAASIAPDGTLRLTGALKPDVTAVEFFPLKDGAVQVPRRTAVIRDGGVNVALGALPADAERSVPAVVTLFDRSGSAASFELSAVLVPDAAPATGLAYLLVFALLGGLLLNAMPCVFPILAMKAMALARLSGADRHRMRSEAVSYSLGVVASFVALGAGLVVLRSGGQASGWGFQFQSPLFVTAVAWLLFAVGLNLSGVFSVGDSLAGRGTAWAQKGGHPGSFLTGVLAVVVASPCTAPFMGTAIAGALALPAASALAVFAALGVGLALPYSLIALVPKVSSLLPRPGVWMQVLQRLLAFPMYAAVVWLVWVASQQSGPSGVLTAGCGLVAVGFAAWLLGFARQSGRLAAIAARTAAGAVVIVLGVLLFEPAPTGEYAAAEPFSVARLDDLRSHRRPVFVNMTASWCLSCLVNERIALSQPAVQEAFSRGDVAYLKGDWTRKDPAISAFLHQLGQDGVPLYVLYPVNGPPVVLPQLLTQGTVLAELAKLSG